MAVINKLVTFAAKFFDMAKAKAKDKNKSKSKSKPVAKAKPVAKKAAKPAAKKAAKPAAKKAAKPAPKKVAKPVAKKKAKPVAKKVVAKPAAKPAKPAKKAPVVASKKAAPVAAKKPVAQPAKKVLKNTNTNSKPQSVKSVKPIEKAEEKKPVIPAKQPVSKPTVVTRQISSTPPERPFVNKPEKKMLETTQPETNLRYSDEELKEFKDLIEKKLAAARDELKNLKESLDNHTESQAGNKAWNMEEGTDTSEMEYLMNQISRQHTFIRNLELALVRVENKTYGICRASGKLIPKERLRVVPHATLSLEAKNSRKVEEESPASQSNAAPPSDFAEGFED